MTKETIEEAAERIYPNDGYENELYCDIGEVYREKFVEGAKSDAARDYWYAKFPKEKKCYHPITERKHTSDYYFECTVCGYNNY